MGLNFPPEPTGNAPYTGSLAKGLVEKQWDVEVLTAHPHYPEWQVATGYGQWTRRETCNGHLVTRLKHYVPSSPRGLRRAVSEVSFGVRLAARKWRRPDVILTVSPALFSSTLALAKARIFYRKTPFVLWIQDLYKLGLEETDQGGSVITKVMALIEGWTVRRATHVVVIHDRFKQRVVDDFSVSPEKVTVVRNWTHLPPGGDIDKTAARSDLGWPLDSPIVLHAGNMGVKQGLDNVVEAARIAEKRETPIRFVLLGDGSDRARLEKLAAGIANITFVDPLTDAQYPSALRAADVLLVNEKPGVSEMAVPSKLTSYFDAGRPVLAATDPNGVTSDEIRVAEAGVTVASGEPEQLLEAALALLSDPQRGDALGARGREYRLQTLDASAAFSRFDELFNELKDVRRESPTFPEAS